MSLDAIATPAAREPGPLVTRCRNRRADHVRAVRAGAGCRPPTQDCHRGNASGAARAVDAFTPVHLRTQGGCRCAAHPVAAPQGDCRCSCRGPLPTARTRPVSRRPLTDPLSATYIRLPAEAPSATSGLPPADRTGPYRSRCSSALPPTASSQGVTTAWGLSREVPVAPGCGTSPGSPCAHASRAGLSARATDHGRSSRIAPAGGADSSHLPAS